MNRDYDYKKLIYKNQLIKDSNAVNLLLIIAFFLMITISVVVVIIPEMMSILSGSMSANSLLEDTTSLLNANSLVSLITFFVPFLIFCLIKKVNLGTILPFEKLGFKTTALLCMLGLAVAMVANYPANFIIYLFEDFGLNPSTDITYNYNTAYDIIFSYINIALVPAVIEEFAFRGVVLGYLRKHSDSFAVLVSAILFGMFHGNFVQIPFAFIGGLMFGFVLVKTNSLLPSIIIHFLNNATSVTFDIIYTNAPLSDNMLNIINYSILLIIAVLGIISAVVLIRKYKGFFILKGANDNILLKEKINVFCTSAGFIIITIIIIFEAITTVTLL